MRYQKAKKTKGMEKKSLEKGRELKLIEIRSQRSREWQFTLSPSW